MLKNYNIFLIFGLVYCAIAILSVFDYISVTDNILIGLSILSVMTSISDIIDNQVYKKKLENEFNFYLHISINVLSEYSEKDYPNKQLIDINNLIKNLKLLKNDKYIFTHPDDYEANTCIKIISKLSKLVFSIGMVCFVISPFLNERVVNQKISVFLTLLAFALICFNINISNKINVLHDRLNNLCTDKFLIIEFIRPNFNNYIMQCRYHKENFKNVKF